MSDAPMDIDAQIRVEAQRLNALDAAIEIAGVLMHPDTADSVIPMFKRVVSEHYLRVYPGAEIMRDPTCPVGLCIPQSRAQFAAWKARHVQN